MDVIFLKSLRPLYCDYISRILCVKRAQQGRPLRPPLLYFYSRPYARGDWLQYRDQDGWRISTRAPTRGATWFTFTAAWRRLTFLLAPLHEGRLNRVENVRKPCRFLLAPLHEGRRPFLCRCASGRKHFYSRPYTRGDASLLAEDTEASHISTRAPTRGATLAIRPGDLAEKIFLLAPLHEGRLSR